MNIQILIDNNTHPTKDFAIEHGLSIYFEADNCKWLFDVGATDKYYTNAIKLGVSIEDVDYLILSHGHADHTGGLEHFLEVNSKAKIYLSSEIANNKYYSFKTEVLQNISTNQELIQNHRSRFIFVDANTSISKNGAIISSVPKRFSLPKANKNLYYGNPDNLVSDTFNHEICITYKTDAGIIVLSACSHNGILNILEACSAYWNSNNIITCIGGLHLIDTKRHSIFETQEEIEAIAKKISETYPNINVYSGHCTGENAQSILKEVLGEKYQTFYSGMILNV